MVGNVPDAQDVYQEALLAAFQGLPRFRMDSVFSTWLYRIAVNKALRFRGRRQPRREIDEQSALETTADVKSSDGDIHLFLDVALQPCHLQTSDGDIDIRLDLSSALTFDCRVADGHVSTDLPILGQAGHNDLTGDLNGGGPTFFARTAAGDTTLAPR